MTQVIDQLVKVCISSCPSSPCYHESRGRIGCDVWLHHYLLSHSLSLFLSLLSSLTRFFPFYDPLNLCRHHTQVTIVSCLSSLGSWQSSFKTLPIMCLILCLEQSLWPQRDRIGRFSLTYFLPLQLIHSLTHSILHYNEKVRSFVTPNLRQMCDFWFDEWCTLSHLESQQRINWLLTSALLPTERWGKRKKQVDLVVQVQVAVELVGSRQ